MLKATIVTSEEQLLQIHHLNQKNLKKNLDETTRESEGFVSWLYSLELLKKMHSLAPSIVVTDGDKVVAYALTTLREILFTPNWNRCSIIYGLSSLVENLFFHTGFIVWVKSA